jgi:glycosyltransferase involved in cell wall biosynthesis
VITLVCKVAPPTRGGATLGAVVRNCCLMKSTVVPFTELLTRTKGPRVEILADSNTALVDSRVGMKVLMIAPEPYFEPRGTPISILQRLRALSSLGYQVDLLTYPFGQDIHFPGLTINRTPRIGFIRDVKIGPSVAKVVLDFFLFFQAIWMLMTRHYDVIHSHEEAAFFTMILSWIFRLPHLYDMHSSLPNQLTNYNYGHVWPAVKLFRILERAVLKSAAAVITIDSDLEEHAKRINPAINQMQINNLPLYDSINPVNPRLIEELRARLTLEGKIPVVYTGTLESYQWLELVIESAPYVRDRVPEIVYVIVGGNKCQIEHYKTLARATRVEDIFIFAGNVPPDEAVLYLSLAHILISMRRGNTSVPLKIYSYLCSGKPILATRTQAHLGILHDDLALLIEPTVEAFAEGTCQLVWDVELRERLVRNSGKFAATMQNDTDYLNKIRQIYRTLEPLVSNNAKVPEKVR